ncbi:probable WRKY transcription factor 70 [Vigna radiata var. radiata]|uniref:Probable WRKY transcription factor 70 n=1 Tax=Vigna radiata var. radiata TaxID=3916 RepID=A0A1S3VT92_VIGRR|nr:probable WRKY transcription factor 70 [Vigna radiata var. radiata]
MENLPSNGRKAIEEELIKGRDIANQLLEVLVLKSNTRHHADLEGSMLPFAEDLVRKVLCSFTNTLLLLNTDHCYSSNHAVIPILTKDAHFQNPDHIKDEPCKSFFHPRKRRGCYKRKSSVPTWETNNSILMEDGYEWRKYGQKITMNAKYLRNYYRCTHKYDEGCPAIKQVQRIQEEPPLYRTTYYGQHNCKGSLSTEIMFETASSSESPMFFSFSSPFQSKEQYQLHSSSVFQSAKQEPLEVIPDDDHVVHKQLHSSDYHLLCEYESDFNYSRHGTMLSSAESVLLVNGNSLHFDG